MLNVRLALLILATPLFALAWDYPDPANCADDGSGMCTAYIGPTTIAAGTSADFGIITPVLTTPCNYWMTISVDNQDLQPPVYYATVNGQPWDSGTSASVPANAEVVFTLANMNEIDETATVTFTLGYVVQDPDGPILGCPPN